MSISITTAASPSPLGAVHLVLEVVLRDGVDVVVELDDQHARRVRARGRQRKEERGGGRREEESERSHEARVHVDFDCSNGARVPAARRP